MIYRSGSVIADVIRLNHQHKMAHFVYAIVSSNIAADAIHACWQQLKRYPATDSFSIFPVNADLIAQRVAPAKHDTQESETFIHLSESFVTLLRDLSEHGKICYLETEYFGGEGGQGACVFEHGTELMPPTWAESDTINDALAVLGVQCSASLDGFDTIGLGAVRKNDDFSKGQQDG